MKNGIKYFLNKIGKSEADFAEDLGVSRQAVNLWIKEKHEPKLKTRKKIAEYFNVSASEIFFV